MQPWDWQGFWQWHWQLAPDGAAGTGGGMRLMARSGSGPGSGYHIVISTRVEKSPGRMELVAECA